MRRLSFAIFGYETENTLDLVSEIKHLGHKALVMSLESVIFQLKGKKFEFSYKGKVIKDLDIVFFRSYYANLKEAQILARYFIAQGKIVIDKKIGLDFLSGKIFEAKIFSKCGINYPEIKQAMEISEWKKIIEKEKYPVIVKPIDGRRGMGIEKINSKKEARDFFTANPRGYFLQKYYPIKADIRILIVGNRVIGGFRRFIKKGEFKSNIHETPAEKIVISKEMRLLALKAAKSLDCEIAGVDIFEYKGKLYVLEVNFSPQWQKFKKVTEINPAAYIIDYALNKFEDNKNVNNNF